MKKGSEPNKKLAYLIDLKTIAVGKRQQIIVILNLFNKFKFNYCEFNLLFNITWHHANNYFVYVDQHLH